MGPRKIVAWRLGLAGLIAIANALGIAAFALAGEDAQVVEIVAQRFSYTPNEIVLTRGRPAILKIHSLDFVHGFNIPDLHIRADLPPGVVTTVRLTPEKSGTYDFLCDNFCGIGHEQMDGRIIVKEP